MPGEKRATPKPRARRSGNLDLEPLGISTDEADALREQRQREITDKLSAYHLFESAFPRRKVSFSCESAYWNYVRLWANSHLKKASIDLEDRFLLGALTFELTNYFHASHAVDFGVSSEIQEPVSSSQKLHKSKHRRYLSWARQIPLQLSVLRHEFGIDKRLVNGMLGELLRIERLLHRAEKSATGTIEVFKKGKFKRVRKIPRKNELGRFHIGLGKFEEAAFSYLCFRLDLLLKGYLGIEKQGARFSLLSPLLPMLTGHYDNFRPEQLEDLLRSKLKRVRSTDGDALEDFMSDYREVLKLIPLHEKSARMKLFERAMAVGQFGI